MNNEKNLKPFGMADKIGYMFGDFGNDFSFLLSSMYLMKFYTDVMGVMPALVGALMMLARIVDAFTDVTMGQICDRSKPTGKGKFTPWIRRMCGPVALASFLMYATWFKDMPMSFKIVWMFATYLLWGSICYTGINIPYGSMASAISPEAKDRVQLSAWRTIGATLANVVIGVVLPLVVYYENKEGNAVFSGTRMVYASLVCSICAIICYLLCYHLTTERVKISQVTEKFSFIEMIKYLFTSRALIGIDIAALLLLLSKLTLNSMGNYIYPNYFGSASGLTIATMTGSVLTLIMAVFVPFMVSKFGKKEISAAASFIGAALLVLAYFMHIKNIYLWLVLYTVSYFSIAIFDTLCWAMITDVIDDIEVKKGKRSDGTVYSVYSFARKLGQALSSGLTGGLLTMIGYTAATAYDKNVTDGIYNITCLVPAVGLILFTITIIFVYPLGKKQVEQNVAYPKTKREGNEK